MTANKQWKEGWNTEQDYCFTKNGEVVFIDRTLYDQLRRDAVEKFKKENELKLTVETVEQIEQEAKKELLYEINSKICEIILTTDTKDELLEKLGNYIRAKTLGRPKQI